jgi:hypothetical protein
MDQLLFNAQESRLIAISFMEKLSEEFRGEFTEEGRANLLKGLDCLINDPLYPEVWRETCEVVFGRVFTPKSLLTKEEIYTNLIEFCVRFIYEWGVDLSQAARALFRIRFYRDNYRLELKRYQTFLHTNQVSEIKISSSPVSVFKTGVVKPSFSIYQNNKTSHLRCALLLIPRYLRRLSEERASYFSEEGLEQTGDYVLDLSADPAFEGNLLDHVYVVAFGIVCDLDPEMSIDSIFTLMIQHCAYFVFGFNYGSKELLNYLFLIRYKPGFYQYENQMWIEEFNKLVIQHDF